MLVSLCWHIDDIQKCVYGKVVLVTVVAVAVVVVTVVVEQQPIKQARR